MSIQQGSDLSSFTRYFQSGFLFVLCLCLAACVPEKNNSLSSKNTRIIEGQINDVTYFIPENYFVPTSKSILHDSFYLRAIYPQFAPITIDMQTLWDLNLQHRKIDILAQYAPNALPPDQFVKSVIDGTWKAYEIVGEEYGLIHQTQPEGYNQDNHDMWIEKKDRSYVSYVNCSKKLSEISVPHCSDHFFKDGFHVKVNFDKRLLPEWKIIREKTIDLIDSFHSPESAKEFIRQATEAEMDW